MIILPLEKSGSTPSPMRPPYTSGRGKSWISVNTRHRKHKLRTGFTGDHVLIFTVFFLFSIFCFYYHSVSAFCVRINVFTSCNETKQRQDE